MERGRLRIRCAAWGGVALGVGTLVYALCSPSNAGCSTNLVVLTHSTVTARGCAAFGLAAHLGVGMMVLGAVLLLGSFILTVWTRRPVAPVATVTGSPPITESRSNEASDRSVRSRPDSVPERVGPIPPGGESPEPDEHDPDQVTRAAEPPVTLPPGWYGNPNNPDRPVQWWDGTKLTDRPAGGSR